MRTTVQIGRSFVINWEAGPGPAEGYAAFVASLLTSVAGAGAAAAT
jgi:hypothetical protein